MKLLWLFPICLLSACSSTLSQQYPRALPKFSSARPSLRVAEVALQSGASATALEVAEGMLIDQPDSVEALDIEGDALRQSGDLSRSSAAFERVLHKKPQDERALLGLGKNQVQTDPRAAEITFRLAASLDGRRSVALTDLGVALDLQGRHEEAQISYRKALAVGDTDLAARIDLGLSLALSGHPQEALVELRPLALTDSASSKVRHDLAVALAIAGDTKEAETTLSSDMTQEQVVSAINGYQALR